MSSFARRLSSTTIDSLKTRSKGGLLYAVVGNWGLRLGGTETRKRNVAILGYRREKRSFFYPQKPLQKQEKQNNVFCEAGFPERTRTNAGRNRKVEAFSPSPKPQKSMAEKLLTSPIAHLS